MKYKAGDVVWYKGKKEVVEFTLACIVVMRHLPYGCVCDELKPVVRVYAELNK